MLGAVVEDEEGGHKAAAGFGGQAGGSPGAVEELDGGAGEAFKAGEPVLDLRGEQGANVFVRRGKEERKVESLTRGDAGDAGARGVEVWCEGDVLDAAEIDDVDGLAEGVGEIVAGAESVGDVSLSEHGV